MPIRREANPDIDPTEARVLARARRLLATNLRVRRKAVGLTQEQLAERIGASAIYLQGLERGRDENPTLRVLSLLAHALTCSIAELVNDGPAASPEVNVNAHGAPTSRRGQAGAAKSARSPAKRRLRT